MWVVASLNPNPTPPPGASGTPCLAHGMAGIRGHPIGRPRPGLNNKRPCRVIAAHLTVLRGQAVEWAALMERERKARHVDRAGREYSKFCGWRAMGVDPPTPTVVGGASFLYFCKLLVKNSPLALSSWQQVFSCAMLWWVGVSPASLVGFRPRPFCAALRVVHLLDRRKYGRPLPARGSSLAVELGVEG